MFLIELCISIVIIICLLLIWFVTIYNRYQIYVIRINEAEANIDSVLRKRFDLLNKSIGLIKTNCDKENNVLDIIVKLRSRKFSNFELDRQLYEALNEFNLYFEKYPDLLKVEELLRIKLALVESESEIVAFRRYYNDIITDYNKMIKTFPSNIVGACCRYKYKTYFDGKDMTDKDTKDMKI